MDSGARPRTERPETLTSPPWTGTAPMIACSVVDFPAPLGPIRPTISPLSHLDAQLAHGRDAAVAHREAVDLEHRRLRGVRRHR